MDQIHKCKECLVISILNINRKKAIVEPFLLLPICDKSTNLTIHNRFRHVHDIFSRDVSRDFINFSSDGD